MEFVIQEKTDGEKKITITIPINNLKEIEKQEITKIRKQVIMNGFRKNKVPINIIKEKYQHTIQKNVLNNIIYNNLQNIIQEKKIYLLNQPSINIHQYQENSDLVYSLYIQCLPKINFKKLKSIVIQDLYTSDDILNVKNYITFLRKKITCWTQKTTQIKKFNRITIICTINLLNRTHKKYISKIEYVFIVGKKQIIYEIEKEIINKKIHDTFSIILDIPQEHPDDKIQGKKVIININIKNVEYLKKIYSKEQLTSQYNKQINIKNKKDFDNLIKHKMNQEIAYFNHQHIKKQIIEKLKNSDILIIPEKHLKEQTKIFTKQINKEYLKKKNNIFQPKYYKNFENQVKKNLKKNYIIKKIIYKNNLHVTDNEIKKYMYENKINDVQHIQNNKKNINFLKNIKNIILENKILHHLCQFFTIHKKKYNISEIQNYFIQ